MLKLSNFTNSKIIYTLFAICNLVIFNQDNDFRAGIKDDDVGVISYNIGIQINATGIVNSRVGIKDYISSAVHYRIMFKDSDFRSMNCWIEM